ncbi:yrdA-like protein [Fagus crenata]
MTIIDEIAWNWASNWICGSPGRRIPTGELWAGNLARFFRTLTHEETLEIPKLTVAINDLSKEHFSEFHPYSTVYLEVEKFKKSSGISI